MKTFEKRFSFPTDGLDMSQPLVFHITALNNAGESVPSNSLTYTPDYEKPAEKVTEKPVIKRKPSEKAAIKRKPAIKRKLASKIKLKRNDPHKLRSRMVESFSR
jgi:hypothetical protein